MNLLFSRLVPLPCALDQLQSPAVQRGRGRTALIEEVERRVGGVVPFEVCFSSSSGSVRLEEEWVPLFAYDGDGEHPE